MGSGQGLELRGLASSPEPRVWCIDPTISTFEQLKHFIGPEFHVLSKLNRGLNPQDSIPFAVLISKGSISYRFEDASCNRSIRDNFVIVGLSRDVDLMNQGIFISERH